MEKNLKSPRITSVRWGRIEVDGYPVFKDVKLFPGGARAWDWRESGTEHSPGIQPLDVVEMIEHGANVVILSKGVFGRLQVQPETLQLLQEKNIQTHVLFTNKAIELYNELCGHERVGALIHSTC